MPSLPMLSRFAALSASASSARAAVFVASSSISAARLTAAPASSASRSAAGPLAAHSRAATTAAAKKTTAATTTTMKRAPIAAKSTTTKAATKKAAAPTKTKAAAKPKKKAAPKPKKKKVAAPKKAAVKPWVKLDANGKRVPLPQETKPKVRASYILYIQEQFAKPEVKEKAKTSATAIMREFAQQWKGLPAAEKKVYEDAAAAERQKYEAALADWKASLTPEDIKRQNDYERYQLRRRQALLKQAEEAGSTANVPRPKRSLQLRDPAKPKRPGSAFFGFLADYRSKNFDRALQAANGQARTAIIQISKEAAAEWKTASADVKRAYEERHQRDLSEYSIAIKAYELRNAQ